MVDILSSRRVKQFLWSVYFRRWFKRRRLGKFWCDRHWSVIENSQLDRQPIDPGVAAIGVASALYLKGIPPAPTLHACCKIPKYLMDGIFEKSRGWIENE